MNKFKKATIRFETILGLQAQVDWKESLGLKLNNAKAIMLIVQVLIKNFAVTINLP